MLRAATDPIGTYAERVLAGRRWREALHSAGLGCGVRARRLGEAMSEKPAGWYYVGDGQAALSRRLRLDRVLPGHDGPTRPELAAAHAEDDAPAGARGGARREPPCSRSVVASSDVGGARLPDASGAGRSQPIGCAGGAVALVVPAMITVMTRCIRGLLSRRDRGATAVEYALIASLIAAVIAVAVGCSGPAADPALRSRRGRLLIRTFGLQMPSIARRCCDLSHKFTSFAISQTGPEPPPTFLQGTQRVAHTLGGIHMTKLAAKLQTSSLPSRTRAPPPSSTACSSR